MEGHQGCSEPVRNRHQQDIHSKGPRFRLIQLSTSFTVLSLKNDSGESSISTPFFFVFFSSLPVHSQFFIVFLCGPGQILEFTQVGFLWQYVCRSCDVHLHGLKVT